MNSDNRWRATIQSDEAVETTWSTFHKMRCSVEIAGVPPFEQEREFLDRGNAVALLAYDEVRKVLLLTRQFRLPVFSNVERDALLVECCGGMRGRGEDPQAIALLEAREELGLHLANLEWVFSAYSSPGSLTEKIEYFLASYTPLDRLSAGGGIIDHGEVIEVFEITFDDSLEMIARQEIQDLRTIALIFCLAARLSKPTRI